MSTLYSRMYLCPLGLKISPLILVDTDVERHTMLHDRQVEAGEQYVVVLTEFGDGMTRTRVLACVTAYDAGAAIGALALVRMYSRWVDSSRLAMSRRSNLR